MVLPVFPKVGLGNNYPTLNDNCPTSQDDKLIQLTNISENIPLSDKYALTRSTKNLFKDAAHSQAN